jgi:ectoine hydroxylase-related dioxygenase (phytanoyl-CoA dioxygenase family)
LFQHESGRNNFEGLHTQRLYALFEKTQQCNPWIEHALAMSLLEHVLDPNPLLSQAQIINILPGEKAQPWHSDDGFYRWPRPRPALGAATIFALDEFTANNGATVLIPGSHLWDERRPEPADIARAVTAEMPRGSMLFFSGTLWHHGGANRSQDARMCLTAQYCMPWCRQQEHVALSVSRETSNKFSPTLRALLGYYIYKPFMGMVDGKHPLRLLE